MTKRPMFQRRHYEAIAAIVRTTHTKADFVGRLCAVFSMDNGHFNSTRFIDACGFTAVSGALELQDRDTDADAPAPKPPHALTNG